MGLYRKRVTGLLAAATMMTMMSTVAAPATAAEAVVGGGSEARIVLSLSNAPADAAGWSVGETMRFDVELTNTGTGPYGFRVTRSNLDDVLTCRWRQAAADTPYSCNGVINHIVSQQDVERGSFEPSVTYSRYEKTDYQGTAKELAPATAATQVVRRVDHPAATAFKVAHADPLAPPALTALTKVAQGVTDRYNIRIPAVTVASNGDLLAAFDKRPKDGGANGGDAPNANSVLQSRSTDGGRTWSEPTMIAQGDRGDGTPQTRRGYSDPSYVVDHETGTIFNFHVYSQAIGVFSNANAVTAAAQKAGTAADPADIITPAYTYKADGSIDETLPTTVNLGLSVSTDNGYTWTQRVITDQVLREAARQHNLQSCFATSGAGTQKLQEPYKGRLLQQLACVVSAPENNDADPGNNTSVRAVALTVYSDDHGQTWHAGTPTSTSYDGKTWRFDENKVVELSDGRLLMSSRTWRDEVGGANTRVIALSEDGGVTWGGYRYSEPDLTDPGNNAQVIRAYPDAEPGTLRSKVLLHSYTNSTSGANGWNDRVHGTIAMSLDDGATWPVSKEFREGGTGYTTMAVLPSGSIGLLMEPNGEGWSDVYFQSFTMRWLDPEGSTELALAPEATTEAVAGGAVSIPLNMEHNDPLLADTVQVSGLPAGLSYDEATQSVKGTLDPSLEPGTYQASVTVTEADDGTGLPRTATASFNLVVSASQSQPPATQTPTAEASAPSLPSSSPAPSTAATGQTQTRNTSTKAHLASTGTQAGAATAAAAALATLGLALRRRRTHTTR